MSLWEAWLHFGVEAGKTSALCLEENSESGLLVSRVHVYRIQGEMQAAWSLVLG